MTIARHRPELRSNQLWSAIAVECLELWNVRLHIICHTSRKTNHLCSTTLFSQDAECNANSQSRHTGENRSGIALATNLSVSTSLSLALAHSYLSLSLFLLHPPNSNVHVGDLLFPRTPSPPNRQRRRASLFFHFPFSCSLALLSPSLTLFFSALLGNLGIPTCTGIPYQLSLDYPGQ